MNQPHDAAHESNAGKGSKKEGEQHSSMVSATKHTSHQPTSHQPSSQNKNHQSHTSDSTFPTPSGNTQAEQAPSSGSVSTAAQTTGSQDHAHLSRKERRALEKYHKESGAIPGATTGTGDAKEKKQASAKQSFFLSLQKGYAKHYKKLLFISVLLLFLSLAQIGYQVATTGDFVKRGISLRGGIEITVTQEMAP
ncbi:MAG: hypothetical protein QW594_04710, partial [Candidatus Woesearchaeota archaeon]